MERSLLQQCYVTFFLSSHYLIHDFVITLVYLGLFKTIHFINNRKICVLSILHSYAAKFSRLMFLWCPLCSCFYLHILSHWSPNVQCMLKDLKVYHQLKTCKKICRIICFTVARGTFPKYLRAVSRFYSSHMLHQNTHLSCIPSYFYHFCTEVCSLKQRSNIINIYI